MMDIRTAEATIAAAGNIEAAVSVASNLVNSEFVEKRGGVLLVGCSLKKFFRTQIEYLGNHLPDNQTHDYFKVLAFDEKTLNVVYASSKEKTYLNIVQGNEKAAAAVAAIVALVQPLWTEGRTLEEAIKEAIQQAMFAANVTEYFLLK
jgi:hypothetical protein